MRLVAHNLSFCLALCHSLHNPALFFMCKKEQKLKATLFKKKQNKLKQSKLRGKSVATGQTRANERTHRVWIAKTLKVILAL